MVTVGILGATTVILTLNSYVGDPIEVIFTILFITILIIMNIQIVTIMGLFTLKIVFASQNFCVFRPPYPSPFVSNRQYGRLVMPYGVLIKENITSASSAQEQIDLDSFSYPFLLFDEKLWA